MYLGRRGVFVISAAMSGVTNRFPALMWRRLGLCILDGKSEASGFAVDVATQLTCPREEHVEEHLRPRADHGRRVAAVPTIGSDALVCARRIA